MDWKRISKNFSIPKIIFLFTLEAQATNRWKYEKKGIYSHPLRLCSVQKQRSIKSTNLYWLQLHQTIMAIKKQRWSKFTAHHNPTELGYDIYGIANPLPLITEWITNILNDLESPSNIILWKVWLACHIKIFKGKSSSTENYHLSLSHPKASMVVNFSNIHRDPKLTPTEI